MDNLSEYIPLIIIIASAIISIVRKTKQPARETRLPEDISEPEELQPCFAPKKPIAEKKTATTVYHKIRMPAKKEPVDYKKIAEMPDLDEYENISIDLSDQEEMKKAVIYSEIFNKKDFIIPLHPNF